MQNDILWLHSITANTRILPAVRARLPQRTPHARPDQVSHAPSLPDPITDDTGHHTTPPSARTAHTRTRPDTGQDHTPAGCWRGLTAIPKTLANSTPSGYLTWSKLLTLFHEIQGRAPVLLQSQVPLSTIDEEPRSPADLVFAGQRAILRIM